MPSHATESRLYAGVYSDPEFAAIFCDRNQLQKWLDVERALALTQAEMGMIPDEAARDIACAADADAFDLDALGAQSRQTGHVLVPTIRALAARCAGDSGEFVHYGATTQDILDTGLVLQIRDAWERTLARLRSIRAQLLRLALRHKRTPMVARTHGQQALPTTFGYKVAVWIDEIDRHLERFDQAYARVMTGNLTGAVGTLASFGEQGLELQRRTLARLGLAAPQTSWHSARDRILDVAGLLVQVAVTIGRIANEVYHLQRTEIDEVREAAPAGKIGSSTMPHKQNPSTIDLISALSRLIRAQMVALTDAAFQQHERDGTAWRIEWAALPEIFVYTGALLARMDEALAAGLDVREQRMRDNLDLLGGRILSERVMLALGERVGKQTAHDLVHEASMRARRDELAFADALRMDARIRVAFAPGALEALLDPVTYTGLAARMVELVAGETAAVAHRPGMPTDAVAQTAACDNALADIAARG